MMKSVFEEAMKNPFDLSTMLQRINTHHVLGNLTDAERTELEGKAREVADPYGGVDVLARLRDHEERLRNLEQQSDGSDSDGSSVAESAPDYVVGKWYYAGDRITHNGKVYVCIAPEGVVCTWSPDEYPAYWQEET